VLATKTPYQLPINTPPASQNALSMP